MVVDLIGIYGLKGPYCMLTMTDWFLQALSVIPRGSWGDVARRFTMIRWAAAGRRRVRRPNTRAQLHARGCAMATCWPAAAHHICALVVQYWGSRRAAVRRSWRAVITAAAYMDARSRTARWPAATRNRCAMVRNQCAMMGARLRREAPLLAQPGRASCGQREAECRARFGGCGRRRAAAFRRRLRPRITTLIMSSIKNPLTAILDSNKFTGLKYQDSLRNLNIVLASEKLLYTIEKSPPKEAPADISPEELSSRLETSLRLYMIGVSLGPICRLTWGHKASGLGEIPMHSTRSVLGKCVNLVTLAMSLFDLQDVCIAIGSIATLDLPMVVDLIGIYGLKGPYCTLTTTNWFLQALSVIPRGSWGDVARRFIMIRWANQNSMRTTATPPPQAAAPLPPAARAYARDNHARWPRMATRRWRCVTVQEAQSLRTVRPRIAATSHLCRTIVARRWSNRERRCTRWTRAGRAPAARDASERCTTGRDVARWLAARRCAVGRRLLACGETMGGLCTLLECDACSALVARWPRGVARGVVRRLVKFFVGGLVQACPGQPVKVSGRYAIPARFWSILKF
ncbi:hypothetical protein F511_12964 [Dorcoceras hygrometricum]|uniref:Uncharacterized protein n=1 Tax=Dorcoceras hygrometricum TaxID=472368 RepID=A0A2Z7ANS6_9LAMI|nr:hypothetical protein F511_12964 [Dorcoceras hygrometricum]